MFCSRLLGPGTRPQAIIAGTVLAVTCLISLAMTEGCAGQSGRHSSTSESAVTVPALQPVSAQELSGYVGSRRCVVCHKAQEPQLHSRHALTLRNTSSPDQVAIFKDGSYVSDPQLSTTYEPQFKNGRCEVLLTAGRRKETITPKWVFGSGHRGFTYLASRQGLEVELHVSYYSQEKRWDITPGQLGRPRELTPLGETLDQESLTRCFLCHTTALVRESEKVKPESSILGVGCEACHGPGRDHIAAAKRREADLLMARLSTNRRQVSDQLCNQCHRPMGNAEVVATDPQLPRLQGTALALSACFTKSKGRLSCLTCHDPHRNAEATTRVQYNAICMSCHVPSVQTVACKVQPQGDCVPCHMPTQVVPLPNSPKFPTHWIKVWESENAAGSAAAG
jgi:predicted CXXCH cytochrome family protein